jgi:hypothetical protein
MHFYREFYARQGESIKKLNSKKKSCKKITCRRRVDLLVRLNKALKLYQNTKEILPSYFVTA